MKKLSIYCVFTALLTLFCLANSCSKLDKPIFDNVTPPDQIPTITTLSATSGYAGDTITITGTNYSKVLTDDLVKFYGTDATVISATTTELKIKVPANGSTGTISLKVKNSDTITGPVFTYLTVLPLDPPTVDAYTNTALVFIKSGFVDDIINITGLNYSTTPTDDVVKFNGVDAPVISATAYTLTVKIPTNASTGIVSLKVKNSATVTGPVFTILTATTVSSILPKSGMVGDTITISGTNFSEEIKKNTVSLNGVPCQVIQAANTKLKVIVPQNATTGPIKVAVNKYTAMSETFTVTLTPITGDPTITSITPLTGFQEDTVTIKGSNFSTNYTDNVVKFNNVSGTVIGATPTQLQVKVPATGTTGAITVKVKNSNVVTGPVYTCLLEAIVTSIVPSSAKAGDTVTINGSHFGIFIKGSLSSIVRFTSGASANIISKDDSKIVFTVPDDASTGVLNFYITTDGHQFHYTQTTQIFTLNH